MKIYLRTQITQYEEDKKEEANMRCSLLHGSWDQILQRRLSVRLLLPDRNRQSMGLWYWELTRHPDPAVLPVGTLHSHYNDVIMGMMASQITSLKIVFSAVYSDADQRKHQSSVSLAFVQGIHRGPLNSPHKWPVTRNVSVWWRHHALNDSE